MTISLLLHWLLISIKVVASSTVLKLQFGTKHQIVKQPIPQVHTNANEQLLFRLVLSTDLPDKAQVPASPMLFPAKLAFPQWLTDFTGLRDWPGLDPPYIPLDFIDFKLIQDVPQHKQGQCSQYSELRTTKACSFDCFNCVEYDDVYTCPRLSQTFDDGPSLYTRKILDAMDKSNTKTTLFTLGVNIIRFPDVYQESMQKGHIMGSHTWSHKFLPQLTNEEIIAQLEWSIWAMNATGHHLPKWFRPPYGGIDNRVRSILRQFGMQATLWDFDTFDWKMLEQGANSWKELDILSDVQMFKKQKNGQGLILEHDAIERTCDVGVEILRKIVGPKQMTVPQCVQGIDYIKTF
ncbi:chitin deacetylase 2 precursor [Lodderomyces elongisporus NRRL YB-4239]|uniref:chitin deacetylase n=1 Tax=Lodderomyces elongisporus (strain ATCC 11503 / CBS 2605 / JCM 1781 / NBRC 1676 / NRRL YB-4239) TaxID=379508 RepID=A5H2R3_LODEL|nr:chitin deacetylase 2 precursor [Lodderomyces elongisporus NRRL YB-4239]